MPILFVLWARRNPPTTATIEMADYGAWIIQTYIENWIGGFARLIHGTYPTVEVLRALRVLREITAEFRVIAFFTVGVNDEKIHNETKLVATWSTLNDDFNA